MIYFLGLLIVSKFVIRVGVLQSDMSLCPTKSLLSNQSLRGQYKLVTVKNCFNIYTTSHGIAF